MSTTLSAKRFSRILFLLVIYLFISPFFATGSELALLAHFLLSVTLFSATFAVHRGSHHRSVAFGLMGLALALYWLGIFKLVPFSSTGALALFIGFYALLIYSLGRQLFHAGEVNGGVIAAALCMYLIIGLLWGSGYTLVQEMHEGAFSGNLIDGGATDHLHLFNYFSIVTLTTLGYGDITPQIPAAASLCQMEAIVGQFFTAVLVARLVGMYRSPAERQAED